jgi:glutaredoxin 3
MRKVSILPLVLVASFGALVYTVSAHKKQRKDQLMAQSQPPKSNKPVLMYSLPRCPFCDKAKALIEAKGYEMEVIDLAGHPEKREAMMAQTKNARTVPQIFIGAEHVGGFDALKALDDKGLLDDKLMSAKASLAPKS